MFDNLYSMPYVLAIMAPVDGCSLQPKSVGAVKPIVKLVGNKFVCIRQLHGKCTVLNI
jgi:hypothetical protein